MRRYKALGFVSGGLDSIIAVELMKQQDLDLVALHVINGFGQDTMRMRSNVDISDDRWIAEKESRMRKTFGIDVRIVDYSEEFLDIVRSPRYGYGKNLNPCIDCKIGFFSKAMELIRGEEADFVFTGEVLGQRPMSQNRRMMDLIEKRSGLEGLILRPLCAKLLPETIPERKGWVDRNMLLDIQGRSRKRQMELAGRFGVEDFPNPAGGCILTDENYSRRLKDLLDGESRGRLSVEDTVLLSVGRHFRIRPDLKVVVGRDEGENRYLEERWSDSWLVTVEGVPSPTVLLQGNVDEEDIKLAGTIGGRYTKARGEKEVVVEGIKGSSRLTFSVEPAKEADLRGWRL